MRIWPVSNISKHTSRTGAAACLPNHLQVQYSFHLGEGSTAASEEDCQDSHQAQDAFHWSIQVESSADNILHCFCRKKVAVDAEDYDAAKALKQDIERLRLAGEASPSGRAANGQPAVQHGNGYGQDQVCLYICVHSSLQQCSSQQSG